MATDSSADKRGLKSSGRKRQTTRHADAPSPPATRPVAGAFGKEGLDRETEGKLHVPSAEPDQEAREEDDDPEHHDERQ